MKLNRWIILIMALMLGVMPAACAETDAAAPGEEQWFDGTVEEPCFMALTLGAPKGDALAALAEKGYEASAAMVAEYEYGKERLVTRFKWSDADWYGEPCEVRAYFAEEKTLGLGLLFEREPDEALSALIETVYARLKEVYGESDAPLSLPESWPDICLKDVPLAVWSFEDEPRVLLVWQVSKDGLVQMEARIGEVT